MIGILAKKQKAHATQVRDLRAYHTPRYPRGITTQPQSSSANFHTQNSLYSLRFYGVGTAPLRRRDRHQPDLVRVAIFAHVVPDLREVALLLGMVELAGVPVLEGGGHKLRGAAAPLARDQE